MRDDEAGEVETPLEELRLDKNFPKPYHNNKPGAPKNGKRPPAGEPWAEKGMESRPGSEPNSFTGYDSAPPPQLGLYKDWGA